MKGWETELIGERVRALIVAESKIPREKLLSNTRVGQVAFWRFVGAWLCMRAGMSERMAGHVFCRPRSLGDHAKRKIGARIRQSPTFAREIARLESTIGTPQSKAA